MNRLHLDFSIDSVEDRSIFLQNYINTINFTLTEDECETCANYILWGKKENGRNVVQDKELQIETKHSTWNSQPIEESLDALLEQPTFSENSLLPLSTPLPKTTKQKFSRSEALAQCPQYMVPIFQELFHTIDALELQINYYDILHGKRKDPPREQLISKFTPNEHLSLKTKGESLTQYTYLKLRHRLVELRREQYTLRDSFVSTIQKTTPTFVFPFSSEFDSEIPVYPLGLLTENILSKLIYKQSIHPSEYTENQILQLNKFYWEKQNNRPNLYFDFCDPSHIYAIFDQYYDINDAGIEHNIESNTSALITTLEYYREKAQLNEIQREILVQKMNKVSNNEIAKSINHSFGKTYSANYISTIFCQKIIPAICDAARIHSELIFNLIFPENFKKCSLCKEILLIGDDFFVKKTRSKDGYSNRCKRCDKLERERKKAYVPKFTVL